jgi:predicted ArsR family transcriptional regulator
MSLDLNSEKLELLKVVAHPTNFHILTVLSERNATAKELAAELGCPVRHVNAQLGKLEEFGLVMEEAEKGGNGGPADKRYRGLKPSWFDRQEWEEVDPADRPSVTGVILGLIEKDIGEAMVAGTLDGDENHISRTPMPLDAEGYEELVAFLDSALDAIVDIRERAKERGAGEGAAIQTVVHLVQCDLPPVSPERS